jgi:hypothetical protein
MRGPFNASGPSCASRWGAIRTRCQRSRVDQPDALAHQLIAVIAEHPDLMRLLVQERDRQTLNPFPDRRQRDRPRVDRVGLPGRPGRFARLARQRGCDPNHPLPSTEQSPLQPGGDMPAVLERPYPLLVQASSEPQRVQRPIIAGLDRRLAPDDAGHRIERDERVRPLVCVHPDHDHVPVPSLDMADEADPGGHHSVGLWQAPIKSRRRSSVGDGRHSESRSDPRVDSGKESQPAAVREPNPTGRTSPDPINSLSLSGTAVARVVARG